MKLACFNLHDKMRRDIDNEKRHRILYLITSNTKQQIKRILVYTFYFFLLYFTFFMLTFFIIILFIKIYTHHFFAIFISSRCFGAIQKIWTFFLLFCWLFLSKINTFVKKFTIYNNNFLIINKEWEQGNKKKRNVCLFRWKTAENKKRFLFLIFFLNKLFCENTK